MSVPTPKSVSVRLSHPFLRFILFFVLTLAVSLPTTALAAPVLQGSTTAEDEAVLLAYYESDATDDGMVGLYFYEDNIFVLSVDSLDDAEEPIMAYGEYEETDVQVLLTILGVDEEDLDEPVAVELLFDADDTLIFPGTPDGLLGEDDVVLYPADLETALETGEDVGADTDEGVAYEIGGIYVSPLQPADSSDGVVYLLNLSPNGDASLNSDYLNMEPPIFELGTWTDNGDNTVTVDIAGTFEEEYDEPIVIEFEVGEYGELVLDELWLYPLSFLEEDEDVGITNEEDDVFVYVAEVVLPDEVEPVLVYMLLYGDGTLILTDEEQNSPLYGEWTLEEETLSVSITGDDETDYAEPVELVFELDEENALVATEYPVEVFGENGVTFYPTDEGDDESVTEGEFYIYESEPLPSEETEGVVISLILGVDGGALVSTNLMNDEDPVLEYGIWTSDDAGTVIVTISEGPDGAYDEPIILTFAEDENDLSLVLVEESTEIFGDFELVLNRVE
jgi:hypothetical protein